MYEQTCEHNSLCPLDITLAVHILKTRCRFTFFCLSSVFCRLSSVICKQSSVICKVSFVIRCGVAPRAVIARRPRLAQLDNADDLILPPPPRLWGQWKALKMFSIILCLLLFFISVAFFLYFLHISQQLNLKTSPFTGQQGGYKGEERKAGKGGNAGRGCSLLPIQLSEDNAKTDEDYKS